jgi:LmbE family N-acetylglucosaminyl deacetylase
MTNGSASVLIVAAHPDDEILGAGIWLHRHPAFDRYVVHLTDGSPRDMQDARAAGMSSRLAYAATRRRELKDALAIAGVPAGNCYRCDFTDKEAYLHLPELVAKLDSLIEELRPSIVISPAYEGGHPDHDAAAFTVATIRRFGRPFRHFEFSLYHAGERGEMVTGEFLPTDPPQEEEVLALSPVEHKIKSRMLHCFRTQGHVLRQFRVDYERFRESPAYDFSQPPHSGPLLYERWGWGISGLAWRQKAIEAESAFHSSGQVWSGNCTLMSNGA